MVPAWCALMDKYTLQNRLYSYPYHYIPEAPDAGPALRHRLLDWGFEYLCYMLHARDILLRLNPTSLLDVGCGDGRLLHMLRDHADRIRQVGVDTSQVAIGLARALNTHAEFICGDVANLNDRFDAVALIEVLEHISDEAIPAFVAATTDKLKSGGHLVVSVPSVVVPLNQKHFRHYDADLLLRHIEPERHHLSPVSIEHVFDRTDLIYRWWKRMTNTGRWFVAVNAIDQAVWRRVWGRTRFATAASGAHVMAVFRRI
jgi:SAM-dependent methyltransferase